MWNKIKESGLNLLITLVLLFGFYAALPDNKTKSKQPDSKSIKTVEEIIAGSYTTNYKQDSQEWDTSFTSTITPIKD